MNLCDRTLGYSNGRALAELMTLAEVPAGLYQANLASTANSTASMQSAKANTLHLKGRVVHRATISAV